MHIKTIKITNFRSIKDECISLDNINVFMDSMMLENLIY